MTFLFRHVKTYPIAPSYLWGVYSFCCTECVSVAEIEIGQTSRISLEQVLEQGISRRAVGGEVLGDVWCSSGRAVRAVT